MGICDSAEDGRRGSNAYEMNPWLWQFGRGKPRLGGLSVEETDATIDSQYWRDAYSNDSRNVYRLEPVIIVSSVGRCTDMYIPCTNIYETCRLCI